jgi:hypothetical protein
MTKKQLTIKDKKIKALLRNGGRKDARRDFFELLRRAVKNNNTI